MLYVTRSNTKRKHLLWTPREKIRDNVYWKGTATLASADALLFSTDSTALFTTASVLVAPSLPCSLSLPLAGSASSFSFFAQFLLMVADHLTQMEYCISCQRMAACQQSLWYFWYYLFRQEEEEKHPRKTSLLLLFLLRHPWLQFPPFCGVAVVATSALLSVLAGVEVDLTVVASLAFLILWNCNYNVSTRFRE